MKFKLPCICKSTVVEHVANRVVERISHLVYLFDAISFLHEQSVQFWGIY